MATLTPAEQYARGVPRLNRSAAEMLAREEGAAATLEQSITKISDALAAVAAAHVERVQQEQRARELYAASAQAMTELAEVLGMDAVHRVPDPPAADGALGALRRATTRGPAAVAFELASVLAERFAREM